MNLQYQAMPSIVATALRSGGPDAYGRPAERARSDGDGNPCRHCLCYIPKGAEMLICAYRPFAGLHPYAETGPIFLCGDECARYSGRGLPPILQTSPDFLLKAYGSDERIIYGTGRILARSDLGAYATQLLSNAEVAFVDVRSARNNCFQLRILRGLT